MMPRWFLKHLHILTCSHRETKAVYGCLKEHSTATLTLLAFPARLEKACLFIIPGILTLRTSSDNGHLGHFFALAIVNNAPLRVGIQISVHHSEEIIFSQEPNGEHTGIVNKPTHLIHRTFINIS